MGFGVDLSNLSPKIAVGIAIILGATAIIAAIIPSVVNNTREVAVVAREVAISQTETAISPQLTRVAQILNNTPLPSPRFVERITVPSSTNKGLVYQVRQTGLYSFKYVTGVFSLWNPQTLGEGERFTTEVVAFKGSEPIFDGNTMRMDQSIFVIGSGNFASEDSATIQTIGSTVSADLEANQPVTLIMHDGQFDFDDNSGKIIVDIYFTPK